MRNFDFAKTEIKTKHMAVVVNRKTLERKQKERKAQLQKALNQLSN